MRELFVSAAWMDFGAWFRGEWPEVNGRKVRVLVYQDVAPRHLCAEAYCGLFWADKLFDDPTWIPVSGGVILWPENRLTSAEQTEFFPRLFAKLPEDAEVTVITNSPLILSGVPGHCVAIVRRYKNGLARFFLPR